MRISPGLWASDMRNRRGSEAGDVVDGELAGELAREFAPHAVADGEDVVEVFDVDVPFTREVGEFLGVEGDEEELVLVVGAEAAAVRGAGPAELEGVGFGTGGTGDATEFEGVFARFGVGFEDGGELEVDDAELAVLGAVGDVAEEGVFVSDAVAFEFGVERLHFFVAHLFDAGARRWW